jgi:aldehyde dehydrogenase (NAD+)
MPVDHDSIASPDRQAGDRPSGVRREETVGSNAGAVAPPNPTQNGLAAWQSPVDPPSFRLRTRWLTAFARHVRLCTDALAASAERETGKPTWETIVADVLPLLASLAWNAKHAERILGRRRRSGRAWWQLGQRHWVERAPVGRVLVIATWNYPVQLLGIQLAQSLAAGNRTDVKPSERCPETHRLLCELAWRAMDDVGLDRSWLVLHDHRREEGSRLLRETMFDHVVFTGSTAVGRSIAEACARTLTPSTLELSGHDTAIVLADADPKLAAKVLWNGLTMNAGQTCMAPRRVLVVASIYRRFLAELAPLAGAAQPLRLVDAAAAERCVHLARAAVAAGGRSLNGQIEQPASGTHSGTHLRPMAIVDCPANTGLFDGDHFGPVVAVTPVASLDEALVLHASMQALATSVFTNDVAGVRAIAHRFGSSFVVVNDCILPTAHPAASIAGRRLSGWGASRGEEGLRALSREVAFVATGRIRTPPEQPTESVLAWIRRFAGLKPASRNSSSTTSGDFR